jgi:sortase A
MKRPPRGTVVRWTSTVLILVGGIVMSYPFWSGAYASIQQGKLSSQLATDTRAFSGTVKDTIEQTLPRDEKLRQLAQAFGKRLEVGRPLGRLLIPRIGLNRVVLEGERRAATGIAGNDHDLLRSGPVHYGLTPLPGEGEPFAVAGHRTTYGAPFFRLNELSRGDRIDVVTPYARLRYRVKKLTVVQPSDVSVLRDRGYALVLTTCNPPYSASNRLIVWADLESFSFR